MKSMSLLDRLISAARAFSTASSEFTAPARTDVIPERLAVQRSVSWASVAFFSLARGLNCSRKALTRRILSGVKYGLVFLESFLGHVASGRIFPVSSPASSGR